MIEEWKPVVGFENFYEVSNLGRVRSIAVFSAKYNRVIQRRFPVLKAIETTKDGYKRVLLCLYGVHHHCAVHRLVAQAFILNPDNLPCVNHKDENPANNEVRNLEWCTWAYNGSYGKRCERIKERMNTNHPTAKAVFQYKKDGTFITAYKSANEAGRSIGITGGMICRVCTGKAKTAGGYLWKFAK